MKRAFDFIFSFIGLILLSPIFLIISLLIALSSKGGVFYKQTRVGKDNIDFKVYKFRSMIVNADKKGLLSIGKDGRDPRITKIGYILRKYKLDELPQLINVLKGDMSLVGPRPEVRKYVDLYDNKQKEILKVRPGITDIASITFRNENDLLSQSPNPERYYIQEIMPKKISLSLEYVKTRTLIKDIKLIFKTILG
ncbi:MAG: sugar transferase [Bacteroidales bacterium]|jgi:lipopolysaccharide/colanic/teichoic acid biosynthesis glycosyltransferase|nr:sugar transferase [Bacteroidales bacterium]